MKWLYLPLFALLLSVTSLVLFSPTTNAASQWDTVFRTKTPNKVELCKLNTDECDHFTNEQIYNAMNTYCGNETAELWRYTYTDNGGEYAIYKSEAYKPPISSTDNITILFSADSLQGDIQMGTSGNNYNAYIDIVQSNTYSFSFNRSTDGSYSGSCYNVSHGSRLSVAEQYRDRNQSFCQLPIWDIANACNIRILISSTYGIQYPSGYAGDTVTTQPPFYVNKEKVRPNIVFDVMNKNISINSKVNDIVKAQVSDYKVYWFITNANIDGEGASCETPFSTSGYSLPNEPLTFEVPCLGVYSVNAYFAYNNGDFPIDDFGNYEIVETTINVDVNGGYFSIDTDNDFQCDENNFCQHESALWEDEQCDLLHLGGCVNNILHYLKVALGIEKTATNPTGSPFISFRTDTHGLLSIVTAPLVAINALTTSSCAPVSFTINQINKTITLPCYYSIYQANLGAIFTLYQTLATGVISYYVIVGVLRQVKDIKDPKKDQIEVVQL